MANPKQKERQFLSIVMPVYNEDEVIETVIRDFCKNVLCRFSKKEFIIVNDCSTDKTPEILDKLAKEMDCLKIIHNEKNSGHGISLRRAYDESKGDLVFHTDSDNQFVAEDFWLLHEEMKKDENLDLVIGFRKNRQDPLSRLMVTRILRLICILFFGTYIIDSNSPFRIFKRKTLDVALALTPKKSFVPSIMLAVAAKRKGFRVKEVAVRHLPRTTGTSFIKSWKSLIIFSRCVKELFLFRKNL
ncbi:MAG: glycosyltransferase family 2 protein [Parcubacteria group bacterium]|nr:glycosyltransferase family 2 protein [Parcubacteria group bacterium]